MACNPCSGEEFSEPGTGDSGRCFPRRHKRSCEAPIAYPNEPQSVILECPEGSISEPVEGVVEAGEINNPFSVEAANAEALALAEERAAALRAASPCLFPNEPQTVILECPDGSITPAVEVTIEAGEVLSEVDVETANAEALALATAQAEAQRLANPCMFENSEQSCEAEYNCPEAPPSESCLADWESDPFNPDDFTFVPITALEITGTTMVPSFMTTFTRFTCNIEPFEFGFNRHILFNDFIYDPSECGEIDTLTYGCALRIVSRSSTDVPLDIDFYPMVYQGGHYYINIGSGMSWTLTSITAGFQSFLKVTNGNDFDWERFDPTDTSAVGGPGNHPDFSITGGPIQMGIRAVFGSLNFDAVNDQNIVWDAERLSGALTFV